jgi:cell division protein FtsZ
MNQNANFKITVIGLGKAGVMFTDHLASFPEASWLNIIAIDTDATTLAQCNVRQKILADREWRGGQGCGGSATNGLHSFARFREAIARILQGTSLLIVTGGLGRGTGTGGARVFASVAKQHNIPSIFVMTSPFTLEGHSKRTVAQEGIDEILPATDALFCLPLDLLFSLLPAETPVAEAYRLADIEMARTILGMAELLRSNDFLSADFSDFKVALNKRKSVCSIGVGVAGTADGLNRSHIALERMTQSALLGGVNSFRDADAIFAIISGGGDLTIGEMKKTLEAASQFFNSKAAIVTGTSMSPAYEDRVQVTAVTIKYDKNESPLPESPPPPIPSLFEAPRKSRKKSNSKKEQAELPLQNISKGIFEFATPSIVNGEDLDIPTCQRRLINIDIGVEQR